MKQAFIAIGSNLGDRVANFKRALKILCSHPEIELMAISRLYENRPVGIESANWFLNAVLEVRTGLSPEDLMDFLLKTERILGRDRSKGPDRVIDLDLLNYQGFCQSGQGLFGLILPHPRFHQRDFVLIPFAEIAPDLKPEGFEKTVSELLKDLGPLDGDGLKEAGNIELATAC